MFNRRATIFGGSGFLGRYIVKRLLATHDVVRIAVRHPDDVLPLKTLGPVGHVVPVVVDVHDDASVRAAVTGVDTVLNLVGILYETGRQTFRSIHVDAAARIAGCAADAGVARLVHVSALGADPHSPSEYARTKAAGEAAVRERFPGATILRPSILVGPEDRFFNRFAWMARFAPMLPLIGGGHTQFQPAYVGDVAEAIGVVIERSDTAGVMFELGGPLVYSFRELMEMLLELTGRRRLLVPIPFALARMKAAVLGLLPDPLLTTDQVALLERDNVVSGTAPGFAELGIAPKNIDVVLPTYLLRFRPGGSVSRPGPAING